MANDKLYSAKSTKNDEFYTQYVDIEKEMNAYLDYNPEVFKNKTILLPCDDPEWSNFTKYFAQNFNRFGLKKLISTSYAVKSKYYKDYQPSLFETESPIFDNNKTRTNGKIFILEKDENGDGKINVEDLKWNYLDGDGDFRSQEVRKLRDEADIIITNPPFSLFKEFLAWILEKNKKFIIIGNLNAITYKEVFPKIKNNEIWLGASYFNGGAAYFVGSAKLYDPKKMSNEKNAYIKDGKLYWRVNGVRWYTNIEHGRRHQPLVLMSEADNIKFSRHKEVKNYGYSHYDNYDAIEVPFVDSIPVDFNGVMGVPISFLDKYCPEQFEIVGMCENEDLYGLKTKFYTTIECKEAYYIKFGKKGTYDLNASGVLLVGDGHLEKVYQRILIKRKK